MIQKFIKKIRTPLIISKKYKTLISIKVEAPDFIALVALQPLREGPAGVFQSEGVQDLYHSRHLLNIFKTSLWGTIKCHKEQGLDYR